MAGDVTARFPDGGEQFIRDEIVQQYGGEILTPDDVVEPKVGMTVVVPIATGIKLVYELTHEGPEGTFHAKYLREYEPKDWTELGEDVTMHTMMRHYTHKDGRWCGYHSRLGKWAILALPSVHECLRSHTEGQEPA